jgi:hypothetical protein
MKSVIDNIAVQAVETLLVGQLGDLLSPARIIQMKSDHIAKIGKSHPRIAFSENNWHGSWKFCKLGQRHADDLLVVVRLVNCPPFDMYA